MDKNSRKKQSWHDQSLDIVMHMLKTTAQGLSEEEVRKRLAIYGFNRLPKPPQKNIFLRFLLQFHNILIYVLLISAAITAALQHVTDTIIILAVVIINALIGFIQEGKAEKALRAIRKMLFTTATVLRNGERHNIVGESLVPGDIVLLAAGDKVPADMRLLKTHSLTIQEAVLTGESVPVEKNIEPVDQDTPLGARSSMAYSGTLVTKGQGIGIVVETGKSTQIGRISGLLSQVNILTTPLVAQMTIFGRKLTIMILLMAILLLAYGYFVQQHVFSDLFMIVVSLAVAAIPEGLPAVFSITLAIGVQAMARRHAIVRHLPTIETIGSVSVICTDKTGTLTFNEMSVVNVVTSTHQFKLEGTGYEPEGDIFLQEQSIDSSEYPLLLELARAATLCNDARVHKHHGHWTLVGDPMEGALLTFAGKTDFVPQEERKAWTRTDTIPFDASHRFMATLHHNHLNKAFIFAKGAPEQILDMCQEQRTKDGKLEPLNKDYWLKKIEDIAAKGQRVLAFAARSIPSNHTVLEFKDVEHGLIFLGIVGLIDLPRPEAIQAVAQCHKAGIQVKMITGDHASTALAIGQKIGLKNIDKVLTGPDLDNMTDAALRKAVLVTDIFARTSPEHKLRLVMALQSHGMIVAMTGDGVNDAPALKRADAGIAMGKKGREVAKEAADLILTDDNFTSIEAAISEGRTVYDNLKKVISWTLPTNAGETMIIIVALIFGMSLPITPLQILWINLITTITLGITLAFEPTEENTMSRPPRKRNEPLLTRVLLWHIIVVSVLFVCGVFAIYFYAIERHYSIEMSRSMALNTVVVIEIFHLFFIRNIYGTSLTWKAMKGTKMVWTSIIILTMAQFAITYIPLFQNVFSTQSISIFDGGLIILTGILFFTILELEKQIRLRIFSKNSC
ncbi:MAG: cation-transporting P-type ATPase [Gammaproteobacteria bacterium]